MVDGVLRSRTDSAGQPLHSTDIGIRNFWRFFDNSVAVDDQQRPQRLYHGTDRDFSEFRKTTHFGDARSAPERN